MTEKDVVGSGISEVEHEERGREVEPQTTSKKTRQTRSKSRPPAPTGGSLEEVFLNMGERIEVVENSLSTLEAHTLEQLDDLKEDQGALREEYTRLEILNREKFEDDVSAETDSDEIIDEEVEEISPAFAAHHAKFTPHNQENIKNEGEIISYINA
ncbi:Hypothetical predicted protein [Olea europaea subsp. europaea]|uniref:Uncharacterized protein n=1 Tax=Olea europaea subsp. europaea TaxID=158383 RepID=A0A8S0UIN4_OLEEU|nr:Hypothetical predicted protein [Olea europaea subsp. europaea]